MKERYINKKLEDLSAEKKKIEKRKDLGDTITFLGTVFFGTMSLFGLFGMPSLAISSGILSLTSLYHNYKNNKINQQKLDRIAQEGTHLQKIREQTPSSTNELNQRRLRKERALEQEKENAETSCKVAGGFSKLSLIYTVAGAALAFTNPALALIPLSGLALSVVSGQSLIKNSKNKETLENRINNIRNDRQVIEREGQRQQTRRTSAPQQRTTGQSTRTNTRRNTTPAPRALADTNERAVEEYIDYLSNPKNRETEKQKIKK